MNQAEKSGLPAPPVELFFLISGISGGFVVGFVIINHLNSCGSPMGKLGILNLGFA
jgi:hypothetical protein